jgi:hypothetical protein
MNVLALALEAGTQGHHLNLLAQVAFDGLPYKSTPFKNLT